MPVPVGLGHNLTLMSCSHVLIDWRVDTYPKLLATETCWGHGTAQTPIHHFLTHWQGSYYISTSVDYVCGLGAWSYPDWMFKFDSSLRCILPLVIPCVWCSDLKLNTIAFVESCLVGHKFSGWMSALLMALDFNPPPLHFCTCHDHEVLDSDWKAQTAQHCRYHNQPCLLIIWYCEGLWTKWFFCCL